MSVQAKPSGAHLRRSERIQHHIPLLISGSDQGVPFAADGESVTVNQYGACVRTQYPLKLGMRLRLNIRRSKDHSHKTCRAHVVCLSVSSRCEYGVELESAPPSFWGIAIPAAEHRPPSPSQGHADTARAMQVVVSGISAICMPFQEHTALLPLTPKTAVIRVRPLVQPGERLRLLVGSAGTPMHARVTGVKRDDKREGWRLRIEFLPDR
jgi:hypothetical protein